MSAGSELAGVAFGLASAACWGAGDFSGGVATRRTNVFGVVIVSQVAGLALMISLALLRAEPLPSLSQVAWGCAAGLSGGVGIVALYRGLSLGQMGIVAPVTAIFAAAAPVLVGVLTQGLPHTLQLLGFGLSLAAVWLLSRPEKLSGQPRGLGLAVLAGLGSGGFLIFIHQASGASVFWPLVCSRVASLLLMLAIVFSSQQAWPPGRRLLPVILLGGLFDVGGNVFFVLATQSGRLDVAAVLSSLYPASTVLLARVVLKERTTPLQIAGVGAALIAVLLITAT